MSVPVDKVGAGLIEKTVEFSIKESIDGCDQEFSGRAVVGPARHRSDKSWSPPVDFVNENNCYLQRCKRKKSQRRSMASGSMFMQMERVLSRVLKRTL